MDSDPAQNAHPTAKTTPRGPLRNPAQHHAPLRGHITPSPAALTPPPPQFRVRTCGGNDATSNDNRSTSDDASSTA
ncbi:hypothetical protein Deima_2398 [Deinococcus maricopensis DSM 21211]|uniref:Uncharacterized protein n=1 Tax=Deinococcus maricopensis (strain DSM 21211 / LMG 22137 / NRRL B-23946 / LB-34) TaxID=709986 RepID=E8UAE7_DEIML|nr:hypothetical protein Deima_2398 [Deinococcus maricopensis DSM 21211]